MERHDQKNQRLHHDRPGAVFPVGRQVRICRERKIQRDSGGKGPTEAREVMETGIELPEDQNPNRENNCSTGY